MTDGADYPHYSIILEWDKDDQIYVVTLPEWPGCHTHGETLEEAVRTAREVIEMLVDSDRKDGRPMPEPRYFDLDSIDVSGVGRSRT